MAVSAGQLTFIRLDKFVSDYLQKPSQFKEFLVTNNLTLNLEP